jgi:hypothetical protein
MRMVKLESVDCNGIATVKRDDGMLLHVIEDGYCSVARYFGWVACEKCDTTDGSVDCEHHTAQDMTASAGEFLENNVGAETDDPGWWDWDHT